MSVLSAALNLDKPNRTQTVGMSAETIRNIYSSGFLESAGWSRCYGAMSFPERPIDADPMRDAAIRELADTLSVDARSLLDADAKHSWS